MKIRMLRRECLLSGDSRLDVGRSPIRGYNMDPFPWWIHKGEGTRFVFLFPVFKFKCYFGTRMWLKFSHVFFSGLFPYDKGFFPCEKTQPNIANTTITEHKGKRKDAVAFRYIIICIAKLYIG